VTPEQEEQVRRALAGLGRDDPAGPPRMPPDVAARLDGVLAELAASRDRPDELAARRRRRWPHVMVAAAAAVVVVGGLTGVLRGMTTTGSSGSASSASSGRGPAAGAARTAGGSSAGSSTAAPDGSPVGGALAVPELHTATIDRDVRRVVRAPTAAARQPLRAQEPRSPALAGCTVSAARAHDQLVAVRLDGRRAVLLLSPVRDGSRTARVYACTDPDHPVTTTTVPAR
jgi:hypothetical protein